MARGKKSKRGGGPGGGLRRPPPAPPREPLSTNETPSPQQQPQQPRQAGGGGGTNTRRGGGGAGGRSRVRDQQQQQQQQPQQQQQRRRQREDPPDDAPMTSLQAAARNSNINSGHSDTRERGLGSNPLDNDNNSRGRKNTNKYSPKKTIKNRRPPSPPPSSTQDALPGYGDHYSEKSSHRSSTGSSRRPSPPPSSPARASSNRHTYNRRDTVKMNNLSSRGGTSTSSIYSHGSSNYHGENNADDSSLLDTEEEQYEEYQEQFYHQQYSTQPQQQQQEPQESTTSYEQQQFSSTHRQFNLTPIYKDVEMTSLSNKGKQLKETDKKMKPKGSTTRRSNPLEYNGKVLAYLDSSSEESDENSCADADEAGGLGQHEMFYTKLYYNENDEEDHKNNNRVGELPKRHEEFYNHVHDDDSEEDEYDDSEDDNDDEERPLRKPSKRKLPHSKKKAHSNSQSQSVLSRSEQCLNRTLVLAFLFICFIFVRDRTPWWKAHKRRVALQKRHHNSLAHGSSSSTMTNENEYDDDDRLRAIDPMAIYNSNDDDSTHTRDHDPLHQYDKYTQRDHMEEHLQKQKKHHGEGDSKNKEVLDQYDKIVAKKAAVENKDEEVAQFIKEHTKNADAAELTEVDDSPREGDAVIEKVKDSITPSSASTGNKYDETTAGDRISNRPGKKSLHHGFMDETGAYENRPPAKNSESTATIGASHGVVPPPPSDMLSNNIIDPNNKPSGDVVAEASIMNGGAPLISAESTQQQQVSDAALTVPHEDSQHLENTPSIPMQNPTDEDIIAATTSSQYQNVENALTQVQDGHAEDGLTNNNLKHHDLLVDANPANDVQEQDYDSDDILLEWGNPNEAGVSSSMQQWSSSANIIDEATLSMASSSASLTGSNKQMKQGQEMQWDGSGVGDVSGLGIDESNGDGSASTQAVVTSSVSASPNQEVATVAKTPPSTSESFSSIPLDQPILNQAPMSSKDIKAVYEDSFFRWNHPLRPIVATDKGKDVPVFWRIPRSASGTVESVMSFCYRMVLANSMGSVQGHDKDEALDVITAGTGARYVNVDMSNPPGIERAKSLNLGSSGLPDVVATPFLFETADVFNGIPEQGKCFTLLRHPVDRAVSLYHHYQIDQSRNPNTAQYKGMTIDEFAENIAENNWMVRFLANKRSGSLTWQDLEAAKEVFGRKCLVGLVDKIEESLGRYERFFKWDKKIANQQTKNKCVVQYLDNGDKRKEHPTYEGTAAWEALRKKNEYDVLLYQFAEQLYNQQTKIYEQTT